MDFQPAPELAQFRRTAQLAARMRAWADFESAASPAQDFPQITPQNP